jgi:hypothetical protein
MLGWELRSSYSKPWLRLPTCMCALHAHTCSSVMSTCMWEQEEVECFSMACMDIKHQATHEFEIAMTTSSAATQLLTRKPIVSQSCAPPLALPLTVRCCLGRATPVVATYRLHLDTAPSRFSYFQ